MGNILTYYTNKDVPIEQAVEEINHIIKKSDDSINMEVLLRKLGVDVDALINNGVNIENLRYTGIDISLLELGGGTVGEKELKSVAKELDVELKPIVIDNSGTAVKSDIRDLQTATAVKSDIRDLQTATTIEADPIYVPYQENDSEYALIQEEELRQELESQQRQLIDESQQRQLIDDSQQRQLRDDISVAMKEPTTSVSTQAASIEETEEYIKYKSTEKAAAYLPKKNQYALCIYDWDKYPNQWQCLTRKSENFISRATFCGSAGLILFIILGIIFLGLLTMTSFRKSGVVTVWDETVIRRAF
jgi:hypothetical protein